MNINLKNIVNFLIEANLAGYGNPETKEVEAEDGGHIINYTSGDFHFCDYFYGGEPFAGQEAIYYKEKPVWAMQYRGWVEPGVSNVHEVYGFLKRALLKTPAEHPYRGPEKLEEGAFIYQNVWQGNPENFQGEEVITHNNSKVYSARYFGGLVDL